MLVLIHWLKILLHFPSFRDLLLHLGQYDSSVTYPGSLGHVERKVQNAVSHWKYDPKSHEYDVALLRFDIPVEFKPNVIPICLSNDNEDLAGQTGWITGWGTLYESKEFVHGKSGPCNENRYPLCPILTRNLL